MLTIRYWAGAKAAAGTDEEKVPAASLADVLADLVRARPGLERPLAACSFLLDGVQVHRDRAEALPEGGVLDVLPPFAGG